MDKLLQPDTGLIIWTIVTFLLLVTVLSKYAWKPIMSGIEERERKIREDLERAEKANAEASALRQQFEAQLAQSQRQMMEMVNKARSESEKTRAELLAAAKAESERLLDKGRKDLAGEADKLRQELKAEIAALSVDVAEKILSRSIDRKVADDVLKDSLKAVSEGKK